MTRNNTFIHGYGARNTVQMRKLMTKMGVEGIGIYWCIIEMMYENDGTLAWSEVEYIARTLNVDVCKVEKLITAFELFEFDEKAFWCPVVKREVTRRKKAVKKLSEVGSKGAQKRWKNKEAENISDEQEDENEVETYDCDMAEGYEDDAESNNEVEEAYDYNIYNVRANEDDFNKEDVKGEKQDKITTCHFTEKENNNNEKQKNFYRVPYRVPHGVPHQRKLKSNILTNLKDKKDKSPLYEGEKRLKSESQIPTHEGVKSGELQPRIFLKEKEKQKEKNQKKEYKEKERLFISPYIPPKSPGKDPEKEPKKCSRFVPPTLQQVQDRINEKGYTFDAETFIAFYQSKNWMIGKNKMKDWKAAMVTWHKRTENNTKQYQRYDAEQRRNERNEAVMQYVISNLPK